MQAPQSIRFRTGTRSRDWLRALGVVIVAAVSVLSWASSSYADDDDPPDRVARVSFIRGDVSVQLANANEWIPARVNRPLTNNDQIWTENGARAELQIGGAAVQLDENTQLSILELSDKVLQLQLTQGVANVYVRGMDRDDTVEVDTPNAAADLREPGTYRVATNDAGDLTVVQVRDGSAEVSGEQQTFAVHEHEQVTLRGTTQLAAEFDDVGRLDDFDRWANARNTRGHRVPAARYVSSDVIGYEDLDDYGSWNDESDYGPVWVPTRVVAGWAPYRYGHWEWIPPWGWTWVDDAPWGFAPFHYGRWAFVRERWCWVPGPRAVRAVYAPAMVAWVGTPGVSVSVSVGSAPVGWVPLGPREIYRPTYRVSNHYVERVNISNTIVRVDEVERRYREPPRRVSFVNHGALTTVPAEVLRSSQPVPRAILRGTDQRQFHPIDNAPSVKPDRAAFIGGARTLAPPSRVITREVVARREPAPIARAPASSNVTPNNNPPAARSNLRVIQPTSPRQPLNAERPQINQPANETGRSISPPRNDANEPNRVTRPIDDARGNSNLRNSNRVIETERDDRGVRRGITVPRGETSDAPSQPNVQRPNPPPVHRDAPPSSDGGNRLRPAPRDTPAPELRNRAEPPRPVAPAPRPQPQIQPPREERPAPQVRPQLPPRAQPQPPPQNRNDNNNNDRNERSRRLERDR